MISARNRITFYGRQDAWIGRVGTQSREFAYFAPSAIAPPDVKLGSQSVRQTLQEALTSSGGVLVDVAEDRLAVSGFSGGGYRPPNKMLRLSADNNPDMVRLDEPIGCGVGDHFVVPIDAEAQVVLTTFVDNLRFFPQDQERNIIDVIRRPRIELRLNALELAAVRGTGARLGGEEASAPRTQDLMGRLIGVPRGLAWMLLFFLLTLTLVVWRTRPAAPAADAKPAGEETASGTADFKSQAALFQAKAAAVLAAAEKNQKLSGLYFGIGSGNPVKEPEFASFALVLEAIRHNAINPDAPEIRNFPPRLRLSLSELQLTKNEMALLTFLGCESSSGSSHKIGEIELPGGCAPFDTRDALEVNAGFDELIKWAPTATGRAVSPRAPPTLGN